MLYLLRPLAPLPALLLVACSAPGADLPGDVRAESSRVVDEVMGGDMDSVRAAFPDARGAAFEAALENMREQVSEGSELGREIVASSARRDGEGRFFRVGWEVRTEGGFTVISQGWEGDASGRLALAEIDVAGSERSVGDSRRRLGMATRLIGGAVMLGLVLGLLAWRRRREA